MFGDQLEPVMRYADLLSTAAVERGLIGPRETPRLWERHLLNCAVVAPLLPPACSVVDVGSGAGLPGIVLALARPDLRVTLVEPMHRRTVFLEECVAALSLGRSVSVLRARAQDLHGRLAADAVTVRALAPLDRLMAWCWPLVGPGGVLAAFKGATAAHELERGALTSDARACVRTFGAGLVDPPTTVVLVRRQPT